MLHFQFIPNLKEKAHPPQVAEGELLVYKRLDLLLALDDYNSQRGAAG